MSRRLDEKERERLRKEAAKLELKGAGAIIRTSAQGAKRADLERELVYLFKLGEVLQKRVAETQAPALVFQEADLSVRVVRDIFSADFERAVVDDPKQHHRLVSFFSPHRARAGRPGRPLGGGDAAASRPSGSRTCWTRRSRAGSTCPAAAT